MVVQPNSKCLVPLRLGMYLASAITAIAIVWSLSPIREIRGQDRDRGEAAAGPSSEPAPIGDAQAAAAPTTPPKSKSINIFELAVAGGIFMIPIAGMSILAVTMTIERLLALRRQRVLPDGLVTRLHRLCADTGRFDPRKAHRICDQYPSAAANVIRAMLLRVGRPILEIESTVAHASQREADRLYANVRWLNLAASLSVLLGLIGTIQGMMLIFHQMQVMDPSADRAVALAGGIYTKLVCTFSGLSVAIPSAFFSHYFEGRIQALFREIEELAHSIMPQFERYEGRIHFAHHPGGGEASGDRDGRPEELSKLPIGGVAARTSLPAPPTK